MAESIQRRRLPVSLYKDMIVEKVLVNRVTLIFAETGSGKSSQVPQMLMEAGLSPILCTQPRRLAVVAVSKMVAEERGCELGGEVGFHIGQMNKSSPSSKIIFKTAGVLLEELKSNSVGAILKYKVVILDEVHERSVESDMVLCCVKLLMLRNVKIRLVLMSATADFLRYESYFEELGRSEKVERIAISSAPQQQMFSCSVKYLEQVVDILGRKDEQVNMVKSLRADPSPLCKKGSTEVATDVQNLIFDLIDHIHQTDSDVKNTILVFLPTYRALEEQYMRLLSFGSKLQLFVLHSSIDIDESLEAMEVTNGIRRVILATDVAESSITIPGASYVIDSCRRLEIFWNNELRRDMPRLVWQSQSQAEQRKGRTGRTCDGNVFRLVPRSVFYEFDKYEIPAMQLLSLRKQILFLSCSDSRYLNDPTGFVSKCLNPPSAWTVQNALDALVRLNALTCDPRRKHRPTFYGSLLSALPLSLEASMLVIEGCQRQLLSETAVIAALIDTNPCPIVNQFGAHNALLQNNADKYYQHNAAITTSTATRQPRHALLLANLCAYEFWQSAFKDKLRYKKLISACTSDDVKEMEKNWCSKHHLSRFALHAVAETTDTVFQVLHRFRPHSLALFAGPPSYFITQYSHVCQQPDNDCTGNGEFEFSIPERCVAWPYVTSGMFHDVTYEKQLCDLIIEMHTRHLQITASDELQKREDNDEDGDGDGDASAVQCLFFRRGGCAKGNSCPFSHSLSSKPVICKFFRDAGGCRYGAECRFVHDAAPNAQSKSHVEFNEDEISFEEGYSLLSAGNGNGLVFIFGGDVVAFAERLSSVIIPSFIVAMSSLPKQNSLTKHSHRIERLLSAQMRLIWGIDVKDVLKSDGDGHGHGHGHDVDVDRMVRDLPWSLVSSIILSHPFKGINDPDEIKRLIRRLFASLVAHLHIVYHQNNIRLIFKMSSFQFSQWQVERIGRDYFFFLEKCFVIYDDDDDDDDGDDDDVGRKHFGPYPPTKRVNYVFKFSLPLSK